MEVHLTPELEKALNRARCGTDELVRDVLAGYLDELAQLLDTARSGDIDIAGGIQRDSQQTFRTGPSEKGGIDSIMSERQSK
jgi:hypothetical protein